MFREEMILYRPGSRKWWRGTKPQSRRVDKAPELQKGRKSEGSCNRQLLSWRAAISSIPGDRPVEDEVARW